MADQPSRFGKLLAAIPPAVGSAVALGMMSGIVPGVKEWLEDAAEQERAKALLEHLATILDLTDRLDELHAEADRRYRVAFERYQSDPNPWHRMPHKAAAIDSVRFDLACGIPIDEIVGRSMTPGQ